MAREADGDRLHPYSVRAHVLTAFVGGPFALLGLRGFWDWRTGRLARSVPLLALLAALWAAALSLLARELAAPPGALANLYLSKTELGFALRHGGRFVALALVAFFYFRQRRLYRALESLGRAPSPATLPAIVCVMVAYALSGLLFMAAGVEPGSLR